MKIAVVILNWNGRQLLEQFLPSVVLYSSEATIYVADNASTDDSVAFLRREFPTVKIIQNTENGGYAKGYNDALKNLTEDLFVLLNSDVEVTKGWLAPVIALFSQNKEIVAAQPKILDYKNPEYFEYAGAGGGFLDKYGYPFCRGRIFNALEKDVGQYNDTVPIFWASGACLFVRREDFWDAGGLDGDYFAHQEEIDLCWRLQQKGGRIYCVGTSAVYHLGGATLSAAHPKKTFYNFRNSLFNLLKNVRGPEVLFIISIRLLLDGLAGLQFALQAKPLHVWSIVRAHYSFFWQVPQFWKKRPKSGQAIPYFFTRSIVYQYFIKRKRFFNQL